MGYLKGSVKIAIITLLLLGNSKVYIRANGVFEDTVIDLRKTYKYSCG